MKKPDKRQEKRTVSLSDLPAFWSAASEKTVLGCLVADFEGNEGLLDNLCPDDFFDPRHRAYFETLYDMREKKVPIDALTFFQELEARGIEDGQGAIAELGASVISTLTGAHHGRVLRDLSVKRKMSRMLAEAASILTESREVPAVEVQTELETRLIDLGNEAREEKPAKSSRQLMDSVLLLMEEVNRGRRKYPEITTGLPTLDLFLQGMHPGQMVVVAARPGVGKTAFALQVARSTCRQAWDKEAGKFVTPGLPVLVVSLEMTADQLYFRFCAAEVGLNLSDIKDGNITAQDIAKMSSRAEDLIAMPIHFDEKPAQTIGELRRRCRIMKRQEGIRLIVVDYMQLLRGDEARDNRQQEVSDISRGLKAMAMELRVPVLVLCQLSRQAADGATPALHHLRESGAIEQDADTVIMLSKNAEDEKIKAGGDAEELKNNMKSRAGVPVLLNVLKQRDGRAGLELKLVFLGPQTSFLEERNQWTP